MRIESLPPYSPDFNPIEQSFAQLKAWMRTHKDLVHEYDYFFGIYYTITRSFSTKWGSSSSF